METVVATVVELFRNVHSQLREAVRDMGPEQLNWSPAPDTNSPAVLVTHTLASELATLLLVRNLTGERDRESEFRVAAASATELLHAIDRADELLAEHGEGIRLSDLEALRDTPNRGPQPGLHLMLNNYGHAREHLGHLNLTIQLYEQQARR